MGTLIEKLTSPDINLSPNPVKNSDGSVRHPGLDNHAMGTIFEELLRRFNEENNEEAGEHWTPRDAVKQDRRPRVDHTQRIGRPHRDVSPRTTNPRAPAGLRSLPADGARVALHDPHRADSRRPTRVRPVRLFTKVYRMRIKPSNNPKEEVS